MNILKVNPGKLKYTDSSQIDPDYTNKMDKEYNWIAKVYDAFITIFPLWKKWIKHVIPYIEGEKILEVSFGNGYLMTQYAKDNFDIYGIDYNQKMLEVASKKMSSRKINANLQVANVEKLPFPDNMFDTIINTMAFTGYSNGDKAMVEFRRVLKEGGKLLLVDFDYPKNNNLFGFWVVKLCEKLGDVMKDINSLLVRYGFYYEDITIGGFGSVHLFIAKKMG